MLDLGRWALLLVRFGHWDLPCVGFGALHPGVYQTQVGTGSVLWVEPTQMPQGSTQRLSVSLSVRHNSAWYCSTLKTSLGCMKMPSITFQ